MNQTHAQTIHPWEERQWSIGSAQGIRPGTRATGVIVHGTTADGVQRQTAVHVVVGRSEGPTLYVQAAVHGDEVNNVEVLRQVLSTLNPQQMKGVLIVIPVVNGPAFVAHQRHNPLDDEDMNRVWPGQERGETSAQIAYNLYQQAIRHADYVVDLHTATTNSVLHVVYGAGDIASRQLAEVFGLPVLLEEEVDEKLKVARFQGKLRNVLTAEGIPAITPELGGTNCLELANVAQGVKGVTNVLKYLGMLTGEVEPCEQPQITVRGSHLDNIVTTKGGFWRPETSVGAFVKPGDVLGHVYAITTFEIAETIVAPYDGYVLAMPDSPVVNFGDSVVTFCQVNQEK